jgi:hypothetical protein
MTEFPHSKPHGVFSSSVRTDLGAEHAIGRRPPPSRFYRVLEDKVTSLHPILRMFCE